MIPEEYPMTRAYTDFLAEVDQYTYLPLITGFEQIVARMERLAKEGNDYANKMLKRFDSHFRNCNEDNIDAQRGMFTTLAEARVYAEIKNRGLTIEGLVETDDSTPDFRLTYNGNDIYAEIKAISMLGSNQKYRNIADEGMEARIQLQEHGSSIQVLQPLYEGGKPYDPCKRTPLVEKLIRKIRGNIKTEQLKCGLSMVVVDLTQWEIGSSNAHALLPYYFQPASLGSPGSVSSGALWHVAFGSPELTILCPPDSRTQSNLDEHLKEHGILREIVDAQALVFRLSDGSDPNRYVGCFRNDSVDVVKELVTDLCRSKVNDDQNSCAVNLHSLPTVQWLESMNPINS